MTSVGICMLFLTIHIGFNAAFLKVVCESSENHGQYGQDSILKCEIKPAKEATDAMIKVVTWKKKGNETKLVVFNRRQPTNEPRFRFSVETLTPTTRNVSLTVSNTQIDDSGEYECMVITDSGEPVTTTTSLNVRAKYSKPIIRSIPEKDIPHNTEVTLVCNSEGGYPEGTIRWFDRENKEWTSSSHLEPKQMDDQRFSLTSTLTLLKNSVFDHYRCSVHNATGGEDGAMTFDLPFTHTIKGVEGGGDVSKIVAPVLVIGSLIVGLLLALLYTRRRSNSRRTSGPQEEALTSDPDDTYAEQDETS